jgi:hypothetical protein
MQEVNVKGGGVLAQVIWELCCKWSWSRSRYATVSASSSHTSTRSRVLHAVSPLRRSDPPAAATSTASLWQELQRRVSACVDATKEDARRAKGQARRAELVEQGAALRARVTELRRVLHAIPSVREQLLQLRPAIAREGWRCCVVHMTP